MAEACGALDRGDGPQMERAFGRLECDAENRGARRLVGHFEVVMGIGSAVPTSICRADHVLSFNADARRPRLAMSCREESEQNQALDGSLQDLLSATKR